MRARDFRAVLVRQITLEAMVIREVAVTVKARRVADPEDPATIARIIEGPREPPAD